MLAPASGKLLFGAALARPPLLRVITIRDVPEENAREAPASRGSPPVQNWLQRGFFLVSWPPSGQPMTSH
jgi:hypothetical protein